MIRIYQIKTHPVHLFVSDDASVDFGVPSHRRHGRLAVAWQPEYAATRLRDDQGI